MHTVAQCRHAVDTVVMQRIAQRVPSTTHSRTMQPLRAVELKKFKINTMRGGTVRSAMSETVDSRVAQLSGNLPSH